MSGDGEAGFSLIEALVVLAISATLLSVVTPLLMSSHRVSQQLDRVFTSQSDMFFFELQLREIFAAVEDPALQVATGTGRAEGLVGLRGDGTRMSVPVRNLFGLGRDAERVELGWTAEADDRRLRAATEDLDLRWPVVFGPDSRFYYVSTDGRVHTAWPPDASPTPDRSGFSEATLPAAVVIRTAWVESAAHAKATSQTDPDSQPVNFVIPVK